MKKFLYAMVVVLILPLHGAAQAPAPPMGPPPANARAMQRRDAAEIQVLNRFINHASTEMGLDASQQSRLAQVVRGTAQRRRQLNQRTNGLHRQMLNAIRNSGTQTQQFTQMMADHNSLRREEQQIADDEQSELQKFLTPRQQAEFLMLWLKLQENARQIQARVPGGPGGPGSEQ